MQKKNWACRKLCETNKVMTGEMYEAGEKKGKGITQNRWRKTQQEKKRKIEEDIDLTELCQWSATQTLGSYYRHWQECIYQLLEMITVAFHKKWEGVAGPPIHDGCSSFASLSKSVCAFLFFVAD